MNLTPNARNSDDYYRNGGHRPADQGKILEKSIFGLYRGYNYNYLSSQVAPIERQRFPGPSFRLGTWIVTMLVLSRNGAGSSILYLSNGKALIGGAFGLYSGTQPFPWSGSSPFEGF